MNAPLEKLRIGEEHDARRKVTEDKRIEIVKLHEEGMSQRGIERETGVSRRQIGFILNPESYEQYKENHRKTQHWKTYYDKDKRREYMRKHRARLREIGNEKAK